MIPQLPAEIVLNVFSNLHIRHIHNSQLVCRRWNNFIKLNESSVYRGAAFLHHFAPPGASLRTIQKFYPGTWLHGVKGWKDLCQRWFRLEQSWEGREANVLTVKMMPRTGTDVHRFKLDEEHRLVITTHRMGGLRVTCMDQGNLLFEMAREYVRRFSHCEYGNGYLIFDRTRPHGLEIWRLKTDDWDGSVPTTPSRRCMPDERQIAASSLYTRCTRDNLTARGKFLPWAFLLPPHDPRAYRFAYPTLLIGSVDGGELYLYDIPSASLVQTIALPRDESTLFTDEENNTAIRINYVEISPRHVFVCTMSSVVIIAREVGSSGSPTAVIDFPGVDPELRHPRLVQTYATRLRYRHETKTKELSTFHLDQPFQSSVSTSSIPFNDNPQEFIGVHASEDGKHFAAVTLYGNMYIVPNFERAIRGETAFSDIALRIHLEAPAMNLAFEHGRICVQTTKGIYIFSLDTSHHDVILRSPSDPYPCPRLLPNLTVNQLEFARNRLSLQLVSCLKMTKSSIWLDWSERALVDQRAGAVWNDVDLHSIVDMERFVERTMCCVNFAPRVEEADGEEERERRKSPESPMENGVSLSMPGSY